MNLNSRKQPLQGVASKPKHWLAVVAFGYGRLSLFRTIDTDWNRTEPLVSRQLGFEAIPKCTAKFLCSWLMAHLCGAALWLLEVGVTVQ